MRFEIGKYYKHTTGKMIHIISAGKTTLYGWTLIAEVVGENSELMTVSSSMGSAVNYTEIDKAEWMKNFS